MSYHWPGCFDYLGSLYSGRDGVPKNIVSGRNGGEAKPL